MKIKVFFILSLILASFLRLWNLNDYPAGFNADEAAIGYNAYSLLQTGKDEYGTLLPLSFKSFGDFKPGLYFYLVMPFVATLGLNEWAVRLPSALLGITSVILIYFLSKEIFKSRKIGVISALLLAISPWHLHFSRGGWETNAATFFITLGVYLFIKGIKNWTFLFGSFSSFLISMYIYQSPRLIIPVLIIILALFYRHSFIVLIGNFKAKKWVLVYIFVLFLLSVPLILQFTSGQGSARFSGLSYLSDIGPVNRINELRGEHANPGSLEVKILHNKITTNLTNFLGHYLDHFRPDFLFIRGDPIIRNKVPETGQFYLIYSIFLIVGILGLIRNNIKHTKLLIAWILVAPIASATTYQTPHALRALNMVIPLTLVMGYGLWLIGNWFNHKWRVLVLILLGCLLIFEFIHYLESYYIHYPKRYPLSWEYGFKEMVGKLNKIESKYGQIIITDRYDQPYILLLFYKQYSPQKYQPQAVLSNRDKFNFGTIRSFDKYQFRTIKKEEINNASKETLFIGTSDELPKDGRILDRVSFPNGEPTFIFMEGSKK